MGLLSEIIPNFITGVSQQPPTLKLPSSVDVMENVWPSVISGASKRPPSEHVANLGTAFTSSAIGSIIDKSNDNQYFIVIADGDLKVFDFAGNSKTVNFPKGKAYLSQAVDPVKAFKFLSIQDTTFILNKDVVVQANPFGELNGSSYVPDVQVYLYSNLPNPNTIALGVVYQTTSDGLYYKNTYSPAVAAQYNWVEQTDWISSPTTSDQIVDALPSNPSTPPNTQVWLRQGYTYYQWIYVGGNWWPIAQTGYNYKLYKQLQVASAIAAYNYWKQTPINSLVLDVNNGRRNPDQMATVFITNSVANVYYNVYVNNVLKASYLSPDGTTAANSVPGTSKIAESVATLLNASGYTTERHGSTITITNMGINDTITGTSSGGDKLVKCWRNKVPTFSDLPPNSPQGRIMQIAGDLETNGDDYYVMYNKGQWEETYGYGAGLGFIASSMPWKLMRNSDGTFTFTEHNWRNRNAGDTNTANIPSIIDNRINDMFLFANRLGFITDTNLILSEVYRYENFFRSTLASLQDSDVLDAVISTKNDDSLKHVVPFNKDLIIFGAKSQYRFQYTQFVGAKNIQVVFTTSFNCSKNITPVNMGNSVYFVDDTSTYKYGKIFEFFPRANNQGDDADDVTEPIPAYIPAGIHFITGSPRMNMLVVGNNSSDNSTSPVSLYIYKFHWSGDKRIQSCWNTWTFEQSDNIYWAGFNNNYLYLILKRGNSVYLEKIRCDDEVVESTEFTKVYLDRAYKLTSGNKSYDGTYTYFVMPYTSSVTPTFIASDNIVNLYEDYNSIQLDVEQVSTNEYKIKGDYTGYDIISGLPYTQVIQLPIPFVRKQSGQGQVVILDGRLMVRYCKIHYYKSSCFRAVVKRRGYTDYTMQIDGKLADYSEVVVNSTPETEADIKIPIMARNTDMKLQLINDSPYNACFNAGEWWFAYNPRTKNIG